MFFDRATQDGTRHHPNSHLLTRSLAKTNTALEQKFVADTKIPPVRLGPPGDSRLKASERQAKPTITNRSQKAKKTSGGLLRRRAPMLSPRASAVARSSLSSSASIVSCISSRWWVVRAIRARSALGRVVRRVANVRQSHAISQQLRIMGFIQYLVACLKRCQVDRRPGPIGVVGAGELVWHRYLVSTYFEISALPTGGGGTPYARQVRQSWPGRASIPIGHHMI